MQQEEEEPTKKKNDDFPEFEYNSDDEKNVRVVAMTGKTIGAEIYDDDMSDEY